MSAVATDRDPWRRLAASDEAGLAEGALLIASEEYPDLDTEFYLQRINEMGATLRRRLRSDISTTEALLALNRYLFDELGFTGNAADFYDARNSYLNDVIERKLGIPVTLAVLYIEVGRHIGLPLHGVSFPSHFLVKCVLREGAIILDPYARGASLGLEDLQQRLDAVVSNLKLEHAVLNTMIAAASPKEIFARMLRNLRAIYLKQGDQLKALRAADRIITLSPGAAEEYRERAQLYLELECFRAALSDFRSYVRLKPDAPDSASVTRRIAELEPLAARLN